MTVQLAFHEVGSGRPVVILHGLFGSKRNWASVARQLATDHRVLALDLRNHGESPWADAHDYPALADDVAAFIEAHIGHSTAVLGHSMGGKAAMMLAVSRPDLVERLVVVDIAPARSVATSVDLAGVLRAVPLGEFTSRAEVEAALATSIPDRAVRAFLMQNLRRGADGLIWSLNLEALKRHADTIRDFPQVTGDLAFTGPTLFLLGGRSTYVERRHEADMHRLFPTAVIERIEAAGHWVHAEAPDAFLAAIRRFLAR